MRRRISTSPCNLLPMSTPTDVAAEQPTETAFSLDLNQDQKDIKEWVHGFAEGVMRPAA